MRSWCNSMNNQTAYNTIKNSMKSVYFVNDPHVHKYFI